MAQAEIRVEILKRLAEQAMSDSEFRASASRDLDAALSDYGYDLNERETDLVHKFRTTLAEAGIDLSGGAEEVHKTRRRKRGA